MLLLSLLSQGLLSLRLLGRLVMLDRRGAILGMSSRDLSTSHIERSRSTATWRRTLEIRRRGLWILMLLYLHYNQSQVRFSSSLSRSPPPTVLVTELSYLHTLLRPGCVISLGVLLRWRPLLTRVAGAGSWSGIALGDLRSHGVLVVCRLRRVRHR